MCFVVNYSLAKDPSETTIYKERPPNNISKEPVFRIETGMHISLARRIGVDAENRFIVTGSDDKTVRVWEFSTGNLLKTLRPPIGPGYEGNIYSADISPDGKTVACGGWTMGGDIFHNIYFFDRESGRIKGRIPDIINVIRHMRYSRDGKYLVITLGGNNGCRVFRTSDNSSVGEDKNYGADSYGADFDNNNQLVTTSYDGFIRLYDKNYKLVSKVKGNSGTKPFFVSFSPDGSRVAIGYHDSRNIDVFSGQDLSYMYSPETGFVDNGNLEVVAWSKDGEYLYAGGRFQTDAMFPIFKWSRAGKGNHYRLDGVRSSIPDIITLKNGGIVYSSAEPSFGAYDKHDSKIMAKLPYIADYRGNREGFFVSNNGFTIQFDYEVSGKQPAFFSVSDRALKDLSPDVSKATAIDMKATIIEADGLKITDWEDNYYPKLNGRNLSIKPYEFSRSVAISPDKQSFLLGTSWHLRYYDRQGTEKWNVTAPATPWMINISGDSKVAVIAFGDGIIRWYRLKDGKNILSLFPHNDRKRWVLWTTSGYYDASAGAEELIGWHVNNSPDMASDFFSISRFRNTYYRTDMIEKVLETLDEKVAIKLANEESGKKKPEEDVSIKKILPPVVSITSPSDGVTVSSNTIAVKYTVRSPSGEPVTNVKFLVNGRPVSTTRDMVFDQTGAELKVTQDDIEKKGSETPVPAAKKESDNVRQISVTIPPEDSLISIIASNKFAISEPATIKVKWQGTTRKDEFVLLPKLYILAIGVGKYINFPPDKQLQYAAKDARDFVEEMKKQKGNLYRDVSVKLLIDENATRDTIVDGLEWIQRETTNKDVAIIFLSGHGVNDNTGIYYFVPSTFDKNSIKRTGVPYADIKNTVANLAGKTLVFVDTCHSGNVMGTRKAIADVTNIANELSSAENGAIVFASSTGRQFSLERPEWSNGAFTKALLEGLSGKADYTKKGKISINMLDLYLSERVKELTEGQQTPTTTKPQTIQDFPIAIVK
jgi:WD40 repeat protein